VALKAIRAGMASQHMLRRFEREAHILGRLHHPNIAQIYEAGVGDETEADHAYFVMELVEGLPMTEHAVRRNLDTRTRLELMARVCDAVQYAHQRGVIHRDLKPGNVLVTVAGEPKILDFGVARYVEDDATASLQTLSGQLMGTLPYMSPEQVCGNPDEIDTRVDVYALGVMLYHLLSGELPFDLKNRSIAEAARIIRDESPRRLSDHHRELAGDVETMVHRAIEREPSRRYQSAADLAADLRRHLAGEPIVARSDALLYVLRKRLWRRRGRVLAAGCIAGLLLALIVVIRQEHQQPRSPSLGETSRHMQAMIAAYRARETGDRATWEKTVAYLQKELNTDESHVVALINETLQPLFRSGRPAPSAADPKQR
jgi:non-specific serine/threonine protein kinase/serine/threonine-protein kinase